MSQAEVAGGAVTPPNQFPAKGQQLRDFVLPSALGRQVRLSDYRGHSSLVLIVAGNDSASSGLLATLAGQYGQIRNEEAEVLVVLWTTREQAGQRKQQMPLPYPVLADEDGNLHRQLGATDSQGRVAPAVYITDRFGEVFASYRTRDQQPLPSLQEILNWLEFINAQCPECEPPEWPV